MEPHCAFKVAKYLFKNINCYQLKANDRFGFKKMATHMRDHFYIIKRRIILVQFCTAFLDSAHSLNDIFVACGITHAEALWVTKGIAADCCHVTYFK